MNKDAAAGPADGGIPAGIREWSGPAGLARLRRHARCEVPDPEAFHARREVLQDHDVWLVEWSSTPISIQWDLAWRRRFVCYSVMLSGETTGSAYGRTWHVGRAEAMLQVFDGVVRLDHSEHTRWRSLLIAADVVPDSPRIEDLMPAVLPATPLAKALALAVLDGFDSASRQGWITPGLASGLRGLTAAVVEEMAEVARGDPSAPIDRIMRHIDLHLVDPDLSPTRIAEDLHRSVRWVHDAFAAQDTTVSRFIRDRRVDAVAQRVRASPDRPRLDSLARDYGFGGRERLGRAFVARFGVPVGEYWVAQHRDGRD